MKKISLILIVSLFFSVFAFSQNKIELAEWNLKFETTENIKKYQTESESVYGWENINLAVDIEVVSLEKESEKFKSDVAYAAKEMAGNMQILEVKNGGATPLIKKGYYVIGKYKDAVDGSLYPVLVVVIINEKLNVAYEITIDCYDKNLEKGIAIAKSFQFIK